MSLSVERPFTREHLVQHEPKGPDVGARVSLIALQLLRRHVLQGAEDCPLSGKRRSLRWCGQCRRCEPLATDRFLQFCQPEVQQLDAGLCQHDVARFQIAMDDTGAVGGGERLRDLCPNLQGLVERQGAFPQPVGQCFPGQILHHQVVRGLPCADLLRLTDVVERADVGMGQPRNRPRFALEPRAVFRISELRWKDLDRDSAIQSRVARAL